jgi:hypothetical protein
VLFDELVFSEYVGQVDQICIMQQFLLHTNFKFVKWHLLKLYENRKTKDFPDAISYKHLLPRNMKMGQQLRVFLHRSHTAEGLAPDIVFVFHEQTSSVSCIYSVFRLKRNPIYNSKLFVSFGDINITRQTSRFLFLFVRKNLQNSFTADAENFHHHLEDEHPLLLCTEILLPMGVLSCSIVPSQDSHC